MLPLATMDSPLHLERIAYLVSHQHRPFTFVAAIRNETLKYITRCDTAVEQIFKARQAASFTLDPERYSLLTSKGVHGVYFLQKHLLRPAWKRAGQAGAPGKLFQACTKTRWVFFLI